MPLIQTVNNIEANAKYLLTAQLVVSMVSALGFWIMLNYPSAISSLFGSSISILAALLLKRGVVKANASAAKNPMAGVGILYLGAVQRFLVVGALFVIGLALLQLEPLAMCVGFGLVQICYVFNIRAMARP